MKDEQRIQVLEDEVKILKNEVKAVLLDLREQYMNMQNPFNQLPNADAISGVTPEPIAKRADTGALDTDDVKATMVNSSPETQSKGNQMHASQLPIDRKSVV